jgi:hypothetical protein
MRIGANAAVTAGERRWHANPFVKSHGVRATVNVNVIEKIYIFFENAAFSGVDTKKAGEESRITRDRMAFSPRR